MPKELEEMTLEELWELFPIILTEHQNCWKNWFEKEKRLLTSIFPKDLYFQINHIGSTAVKNIWAKPIIDILIETNLQDFSIIKESLTEHGYLCMSEESERMSFNKGYSAKGFKERVFHLHLRKIEDNDEVYFRDFLISNPVIASEYEKLKLFLWKKYKHDRDGYTNAKHDFVLRYTEEAKKIK